MSAAQALAIAVHAIMWHTICWKFMVVHDDRTLMSHGNVAGHSETLSWYIDILRR
jgi:hypothetical protein